MTQQHFEEPLLERIANWSGWEFVYEQRNRVFISVSACVICLFAIVFVISSYVRTSQNHVAVAEHIITKLHSGQETAAAYAKLFTQLKTVLPKTKHVTHEFAGIVTQESLLQHEPIQSWVPVYRQLASPSLKIYKEIVALSEDIALGKNDRALERITVLTQQPLPPTLHAYLVLEHICLLRQTSMPFQKELDQLRSLVEQDPVTAELFSAIDQEGSSSILEFFQLN